MTLDTEPTLRLPVIDVPSAVITNSDALRARATHRARQQTASQRRWDILAQVLSYLCFAGILVCLVGIGVAGVLLALSMADQDGALPAPDSTTTTAASLTLPSMPSTAYPLLGGVALDTTIPAATAGTTRAVPRPTSTTGTPAAASTTTTPPVPTTVATLPATTTTTAAPAPSSTEPATTASSTTTTAGTTPVPTDPSTTTTEPAPPAST